MEKDISFYCCEENGMGKQHHIILTPSESKSMNFVLISCDRCNLFFTLNQFYVLQCLYTTHEMDLEERFKNLRTLMDSEKSRYEIALKPNQNQTVLCGLSQEKIDKLSSDIKMLEQ